MMKKILTIISCALLLLTGIRSTAQLITVQHDTVSGNASSGLINIPDNIAGSTGSVTVSWKVVASDFPADWLPLLGICDDNLCYNNSPTPALWPTGAIHTNAVYGTFAGDFHAQIDLSTATTIGCHYVKVRLYNTTNSTTVADSNTIVTFIVCKSPTAVPNVSAEESSIALYPNPANNELNVVYDASADIKNIAVYNIIGKVMSVYKVAGNSANLNIENIPSGIYFVRLFNSNGNVVVTRKFTKQ